MKEIIDMFPYFAAILVGNIFYNFCFEKLNDTKLKINLKNMLVILFCTILVWLCNVYIKIEIKNIMVCIIMCIYFKILYNKKIKETIFSYVIIYLILIFLEIIITNTLLITGFLSSNKSALELTMIKVFLSITIIGIEYVLFLNKKIKEVLQKLLLMVSNNVNMLNILYLIFISLTILSVFNINKFATSNSSQLLLILIVIFALLFTLIIKTKTHEENLKQSNKRLVEYNEKYGKFLDEYKIYKHNIKHKLAGMKAFGNKKINALIDDLLEEETSFTIKNNNIYNVPKEIKGIVAERLYNAKISVIVDNKLKEDPFKNMSPKEFNHISESIGICLDNAVEASIETENPIVTLDLYEDKEYIYIKIGNTFSNNIDIDELGNKYYSTKNRGSGLGLFSLKQNKFIQEKISIINDIYYIELKIKKHADC